eukprot:CAMPEP_0114678180 /NCGR_PEP_ID=MMETSP0191-20121206/51387_1 /TAXON_ID=126664 /ORGANISM="Sorites sp." /LENGTH=170 /DNA_ID=CAMNT_0001951739 /DNA_START=51 /DNA_END=559 /DNA_ORIENTATION=+
MAGRLSSSQDFILKNFVLILAFCSLSFLYTSRRESLQSLPTDRPRSSSKAPASRAATSKFAGRDQAASGVVHHEEVEVARSRPKSSMPKLGNVKHFDAQGAGEEGKSRPPLLTQKKTPLPQPKEVFANNASAERVPDVKPVEEETTSTISDQVIENDDEESVVVDIPETG